MMHKNKSVDVHQFAMIPKADIPRSSFRMQKTLKTSFDAGYLVPMYCEEVLPGDTFNVKVTAFARLATPLFPVMDNLHLETFFFFVPNRLVWSNWKKMMGEQDNPADSISYVMPTMNCTAGGYAVSSIFDYFGLPTAGQVGGGLQVAHQTLPLRAYNLIFKEWFRDQNLQNSPVIRTGDSGDLVADFALLRRGKRHDYFTSCLPWTQKATSAVTLPLGTEAIVKTKATETVTGAQSALTFRDTAGGGTTNLGLAVSAATPGVLGTYNNGGFFQPGSLNETVYPSNLYADLSTATAATINQIRQAFQIQRLLERDARGGTRYTEQIFAHFGVKSPDARLQRPEYLGGGKTAIIVNPIAQTSATGLTGGSTPAGSLAAVATGIAHDHGFTQSFTEHGYVLGLVNVYADLTYQQGLRRHWSRSTKYDFYWPVFANLGEQSVLNKEIYVRGDANDALVFGYQERWAEYRYNPSEITGLFRSTSAGTIDPWHLAQRFTSLPTLNDTFIQDTPPVSRVLAVGAGANGQQLLMDAFFDCQLARPMPLYSVPGLVDHF